MAPDDDRDDVPHGQPLPPEDRLWRHPSEMHASSAGPAIVLIERGPGGRRVFLVALVSVLLGAGSATGVLLGTGVAVREGPTTTSREVRDVTPGRAGDHEIAIADSVLDAVARVEVSGPKGAVNAGAVGFRSDGQLVTTADAVDGASQITVVLRSGRRLTTPDVVVVGTSDEADIAVLKIPVADLPVAAGSQRRARFGEQAVVVDGSLATSGPSIAVGVITEEVAQVDRPQLAPLYGLVEATTQAGLDPLGAGALFLDEVGSVVGLVTGRAHAAPSSPGVSRPSAAAVRTAESAPDDNDDQSRHYAVPADYAWNVAAQLADAHQVLKPWVGLPRGEDITVDEANRTQIQGGMRVTTVEEHSPARTAGLQVEDVVVAVGPDNVRSYNEFVAALRRLAPGTQVIFTLIHRGEYVPKYVDVGGRVEK